MSISEEIINLENTKVAIRQAILNQGIDLSESDGFATYASKISSIVGQGANMSSRNVGEIITSTIPLTDAGLHLLDGSLINGSGSYSAFVNYISDLYEGGNYPDLFLDDSTWQEIAYQYGVCGKFVYDAVNNTVRLPKIIGIIEGTTDLTALGDLVQAGLPNIIGGVTDFWCGGPSGGISGAFAASGSGHGYGGGSSSGTGFDFNASRSSSIYGNSNTVQPQTIKILYYIVIANSTKTPVQVDIDEIVTDLDRKADKDLKNCIGNLSDSSKDYIIQLTNELDLENKINITTTSLNDTRTFTYPDEGLFTVYASGSGTTSNGKYNYAVIYSEDSTHLYDGGFYASSIAMTYSDRIAHHIGKKGEIVNYYLYSTGWTTNRVTADFIPFKKS